MDGVVAEVPPCGLSVKERVEEFWGMESERLFVEFGTSGASSKGS